MKLYIPAIKDRIRLTAPLVVPVDHRHPYETRAIGWKVNNPGETYNYRKAAYLTDFTLEAGTVLEFQRYFISAAAKEDRVKLRIFASPRRDLTPKKNGGLARLHELQFSVPTSVLNTIEYERVD